MRNTIRKGIRKLLGVITAAVMAVGVMGLGSTPVQAAGVELTINPAPNGSDGTPDAQRPGNSVGYPSYEYWVMMWASVGSDNRVSYYVDNEDLASALDNLKVDGKDLFTVTHAGNNNWNVTINNKTEASGGVEATSFTGDEVAAALNGMANKDALAEEHGTTKVAEGQTTASFSIDRNGYVLITSSLGSKLVVDTYGNKTIYEKNVYPTSTKTQSKEENGKYTSDDLSEEVGKTVYYHIDIRIPANANQQIVVYDTITKGLTISSTASLSATYGTPMSSIYWGEGTASEDGKTITYSATIPAETVEALAHAAANADGRPGYTTLTLAYSAVVNGDAIDYDTATHEQNKSYISYGNDFRTEESTVDLYTYKFRLLKYDGAVTASQDAAAATPLGGAVFELYRKNETDPVRLIPTDAAGQPLASGNGATHFRVAAGGENGAVTQFTSVSGAGNTLEISGLDKDTTYTLREVQAPEGYNRLEADVTLPSDKIIGGDIVPIENHQGTVLPSTGGIGTTIFYVAGIALIAGAAVVLIARRKKNA